MKKGWTSKRIREIATIKPPKSEARERVAADALVSFLPMEDLGKAIKYPEPKQIKRFADVVGSYTYFAEGDVLLAKITPCFENGKLGIANGLKNGVGFGSSEFIVIRPDPTVNNEWLFHFLSRDDFRNEGAQRMGGAVGQQRVAKEFVEDYEIPVPPLSEQRRIVRVLDETFTSLATAQVNAEKNLQNTRALLRSAVQHELSAKEKIWSRTTIGKQVTLQRGFDITKKQQRQGGVPVVSSGGVKSFHDTAMVQGPGVVIGRKGTLGKVFYVESSFWPHDTTLWIKSFNENYPRFVYYFFTNLSVTHLDSGAANPALNRNQVHPIEVHWPSVSEQKVIAEKLDAIALEIPHLELTYEKKLIALDELKQSLLQQAFNGEL